MGPIRRWGPDESRRGLLLTYLAVQLGLVVAGAVIPGAVGEVLDLVVAALGAIVLTAGVSHWRPRHWRSWWPLVAAVWVTLAGAMLIATQFGLRDHLDLTAKGELSPVLLTAGLSRLLLAYGVLRLAHVGGRGGSVDAVDASLATLGVFLLGWAFALDPVWASRSALVAALSFLAGSVLVIAGTFKLLLTVGVRRPAAALVVVGAFALALSGLAIVAVSAAGTLNSGVLNDVLWPLFPAAFGAIGLLADPAVRPARAPRTAGDLTRSRVLFFAVLALIPPVAMTVEFIRHDGGPRAPVLSFIVPAVASVGFLLLLVWRIGLIARVAHDRADLLRARTGELTEAIHAQQVLEERLRHRATHDSLTGLLNRSGLTEAYDQLVHHAHGPWAILLVDLDGFKEVNDTMGHLAGDACLIKVAQRLQRITPPAACLVRLGGDEFAILMPDARTARSLAGAVLRAVAEPPVDGAKPELSASIGLAIVTSTQGHPTLSGVIRDADQALYAAKAAGKNRFRIRRATSRPDGAGTRPAGTAEPISPVIGSTPSPRPEPTRNRRAPAV
jgi:diguanylate cyclase (GGDEF)-like protein